MKKVPIWELLIEKGFFDDKKTAESWIMMGRVFANGNRVNKVGQLIKITDEIVVKGINQKYVSKGGLKLEGALKAFKIDVTDVVAIDAGASTGGFTDCLIQHGAKLVYAVDVGYGQLAGKLHINERVISMEKLNIGEVDPDKLTLKPTLATVDLSYLSLKKAIPIFANILRLKGEIICLVKPLFEVKDSSIRRNGEIDDPAIYKELLIELEDYVHNLGFKVAGVTHSPVTGNKGTREFFMRILLDKEDYSVSSAIDNINLQIEDAVKNVMNIDLFKKAN